jgi:SAM-dependent methyltransferase
MTWFIYRPYQLLQSLYWDGFRGRLGNFRTTFLNTDRRPVPVGSLQEAVARYRGICKSVLSELANGPDLKGAHVCELGAGNCLATTALFLGLGAQQVEVFEPNAPVIDSRQQDVLKALRAQGLPLDIHATLIGAPTRLNEDRIKWHLKFVEAEDTRRNADFIFSFSVLEHVEDLLGAMNVCFNLMKPGARMVHVTDLGGHGFFEDPIPPLDFQVYPDWLYSLMYPKYGRATRRPMGEYVASARAAGFKNVVARPIRLADPVYLESIWPHLNSRIQKAGRDEVRIIEFVLSAGKPTDAG